MSIIKWNENIKPSDSYIYIYYLHLTFQILFVSVAFSFTYIRQLLSLVSFTKRLFAVPSVGLTIIMYSINVGMPTKQHLLMAMHHVSLRTTARLT